MAKHQIDVFQVDLENSERTFLPSKRQNKKIGDQSVCSN